MNENEQPPALFGEPPSVSPIPAEVLLDGRPTHPPPPAVSPESRKPMDNRPEHAAELRQRAEEIAPDRGARTT